MRKFARGILVLLLVTILGGVGSYLYEYNTIKDMYRSVAQLYVVPGEANEATLRAENGGLKDDFSIVLNSDVVLSAAKNLAGTSENLEKYLTVNSVANSNIIELVIVNPDQNTAKTYVDAIAATAVKTTTIIPVESIQILSEGTSTGDSFKPNLMLKTIRLTALVALVTFALEMLVLFFYLAFRKRPEIEDEYYDYEREYGAKSKKSSNKRFENDYIAPNVSNDAIVEFDEYISKSNKEKEAVETEAKVEEAVAETEAKVEEAVEETEAKAEEAVAETEAKVEETVAETEAKVDEAVVEAEIKTEEAKTEEVEIAEKAEESVVETAKTETKEEPKLAEVAANEDEVAESKEVETKTEEKVEVKKKKLKIFGRVKK
jgi:capsular polysaccharide biosynthesis protein